MKSKKLKDEVCEVKPTVNRINKVKEFSKNPKKALIMLSYPIIIAMLVQTLYNIVDTAFIGRLGSEAIASLTFAFPVFFILISINSGIGVGINSRISRFLGEKDYKSAQNTAIHGLLLAFLFSVFIFVVGLIFMDDLFLLLGAKGNTLKLSLNYMNIIIIGVFFMFPAYVFNSIFSAHGDTKVSMKIQIIALILNIILDPIFIYYLKYGVRGAAIATVIALGISLLLYIYYNHKNKIFILHWNYFKFSGKLIKEIFLIGIFGSIMMLMLSLASMFINNLMSKFGINYVAAFGLVNRLESLATMPLISIAMASITLVGMFYGARKYYLLKEITIYAIKITTIFSLIIGLVFFLFAETFMRIFTDDAVLIKLASDYLRIDVFTFPLIAIIMLSSRIMQGIGNGVAGLIINFVRVFIIGIPLAYAFVYFFGYGYLSVALAIVTGCIFASFIGILLLKRMFIKLEK